MINLTDKSIQIEITDGSVRIDVDGSCILRAQDCRLQIIDNRTPDTELTTNCGPHGNCARCGGVLDNVSPGFGVYAGNAFCCPCLKDIGAPRDEVALARSIDG